MNQRDLEKQYQLIKNYHEKYLKTCGVKLPTFGTKDALVLIKLSEGYPNTKVVSKSELTTFMRQFYPDIIDVQQARHLGQQKGWNIASGTRGDDANIPAGSYKLISLETPYPGFCVDRRAGFEGDFEEIKKQYDYRCATCGAKEGEKHFFRKSVTVQLQEGHMDCTKQLAEGNIIPQCQICNRPDRNRWIFDITGRVIEVAPTNDGARIVERFLEKASPEIRNEIRKCLEKLD